MNEIFLFLVTKVICYFCLSQGVNSIKGHASLLLLLLKNVLEETRLFRFERVRTFTIVSVGNDCFVLDACKYNKVDISSPLQVPTRCLLSLVSNGNLILLSFL